MVRHRRFLQGDELLWHHYDLRAGVLLNILEGQLHIAVLVIVVDVLPPIMHGQEIKHADAIVALPVFEVMVNQHRQFEQLAQACGAEEQYQYGDMGENIPQCPNIQ